MEIDSFPDRISNLQAELKKCGNEIMTHISGLYSDDNIGTMNLKNGPRNAIKLLQHDVIDCLQLAQERSNIRNDYMPDVNNCRSLIEIISKVSEIATKISQAEETIRGSNLLLACRLISEVKSMLTEIPAPNTEIGTGEVCKVLRKEARLLQARLLARIKRLLGNCIVCECGRLSVTKRLEGMLRGCSEDSLLESAIELSDIWTALISLDSAEESANAVVDTILKVLKVIRKESAVCFQTLTLCHLRQQLARNGSNYRYRCRSEDNCYLHCTIIQSHRMPLFLFIVDS